MLFEVAKLLGLQENKKINENQTLLLRLLTPLLKLYNGKMVLRSLDLDCNAHCVNDKIFCTGCAVDERRVGKFRRYGLHGRYRPTNWLTRCAGSYCFSVLGKLGQKAVQAFLVTSAGYNFRVKAKNID